MIRKNKISTPSYFIKRLRDNCFITNRIYDAYPDTDPRRWTIMVEPGIHSIFITCFENKNFSGEILFEINDGNQLFQNNVSIKTDSIEVIITLLLSKGVHPSGTRK